MKNEYKVTRETILSEAKGYHFRSPLRIFFFAFWCLAGVFWGAMSALLFVLGSWIYGGIGVLVLLLCIYKLFISPARYFQNKYRALAAQHRVPEWTRTFVFGEEEILLTDHKATIKIKYTDIKRVKEKGNTVLLILGGNLLMRIYKDAFTEGTWEECKEKLASIHK